MADKPVIGVRYCGGCNPRFDRVALVRRLAGYFPACDFESAQPAGDYPAVLVVCGCPSRCADTAGLGVPPGRLIWLSGWDDLLPARDRLTQALAQADAVQSLDHEQVLALLPHRPPMLLIDTVSSLIPGESAQAHFYVRPDLEVFSGHFPGSPILPGIYTAEAAAQAAALLLLTLERYAGMLPLFTGIRQANFRRPIGPGDRMEIHVSLLEERAALAMAMCRGEIFTGGALAADLEVRLSMRAPGDRTGLSPAHTTPGAGSCPASAGGKNTRSDPI